MYMLIRRRDGSLIKAVVVARTRYSMRVAPAGYDDVIELRHCGSDWLDESNEPVEFEFTGLIDSGGCWRRMMRDMARGDGAQRVQYAYQ